MDREDVKQVLILCTGNSCRSQMAEVIWNDLGRGRWHAQSAGSHPSGYVHPLAIEALKELNLPVTNLSSKSSDRFVDQPMDLVVTVCGNAQQSCPTWPSARQILHWPFQDPADATGSDEEKLQFFRKVRDQIREQISKWLGNTSPAES